MSFMFSECYKLKEIKGLNLFITNNLLTITSMFHACYHLECIDLSNFNTSNITNMEFVFNKCYKLKVIKGLNKFDTNKVIFI